MNIMIFFYELLIVIISVFILASFFYELFKTFENNIAMYANKLKSNSTLKFILILICDFIINASYGVGSIALLAFGIDFADSIGIPILLGNADILKSSIMLIVFIVFYAIILALTFGFIKNKIKN